MIAPRAESNRVDTVLVALLAFCPLDKTAVLGIPNADALVQAAGRDVAVVWRHGDSSDAIFNGQGEDTLVLLDIPEANSAVAGAGGDVAAVGGEVEGVDILLVTAELVSDCLCGDLPDLILSSVQEQSL